MEFPKILKKVFVHHSKHAKKGGESAETAAPDVDEETVKRMEKQADELLKEEKGAPSAPTSPNEVKVEVPIEVPLQGAKSGQQLEVRFEKSEEPAQKEVSSRSEIEESKAKEPALEEKASEIPQEEKEEEEPSEPKPSEVEQKETVTPTSEQPVEAVGEGERSEEDLSTREGEQQEEAKQLEQPAGEINEPEVSTQEQETQPAHVEKEIGERGKLEQEAFPLENVRTGQPEPAGEIGEPEVLTQEQETEPSHVEKEIGEREKLEQEAFPLEKVRTDQPEPEIETSEMKKQIKNEVVQELKEELLEGLRSEQAKKQAGGKEAAPSSYDEKLVVVIGAEKVGPLDFSIVKGILKEHPDWTAYLTARDSKSGDEAVARLRDEFNLKSCKFYVLDVNSMVSLRRFRDHLTENHQAGIYILVNNSGTFPNVRSFAKTSSSDVFEFDKAMFEETVTSNYFNALSVCLELFPILANDARVVLMSSRFSQLAYMHSNQVIQGKLRGCTRVEQVSELMEMFITTDLENGIQQWMTSSPNLYAYQRYSLGSFYTFGIAKLGVNLLASCYQRQLEAEKSSKNVHVNAVCPGLMAKFEAGDRVRSPDEAADTIIWLVLQPSDNNIKGKFVADRKIWDLFVVPPPEQQALF